MVDALRRAGARFWLGAAAWTIVIGLATGVPTVLIDNPFFRRMTPASRWQYVSWAIAAAAGGLVLAARNLSGVNCKTERRTVAGNGLAFLAVGCPICNKVVVGLLGVSGALTYFAPLQPVLGVASLILLLTTLRVVLRRAAMSSARLVPGKDSEPRSGRPPVHASGGGIR
jgi:hypothetical protein